jgi:hypothetical protein
MLSIGLNLQPQDLDERVLRWLYETKQSVMTLSCLSEKRLETRQLLHAQLALQNVLIPKK